MYRGSAAGHFRHSTFPALAKERDNFLSRSLVRGSRECAVAVQRRQTSGDGRSQQRGRGVPDDGSSAKFIKRLRAGVPAT